MVIWWHRRKHGIKRVSKVTVPIRSFDKGLLIICNCGKVWAK